MPSDSCPKLPDLPFPVSGDTGRCPAQDIEEGTPQPSPTPLDEATVKEACTWECHYKRSITWCAGQGKIIAECDCQYMDEDTSDGDGGGGGGGGGTGKDRGGSPVKRSQPLNKYDEVRKWLLTPLAPLGRGSSGCGMQGPCSINPASGNLVARIKIPAGGTFDSQPVLTYNSSYGSSSSDYGAGWLGYYNRHVTNFDSGRADVVTGEGTVYHYTDRDPMTDYYKAPPGATSSLNRISTTNYREVQSDGTQLFYVSSDSVKANLTTIQNPAGKIWTLAYDVSNKLLTINTPFGRQTSFTYDGSGKIKRIRDASGRITSMSVNAGGDLVRLTSPELCITSFLYDGSHRIRAWINPETDRTTFTYDVDGRVKTRTSPRISRQAPRVGNLRSLR